MKDPQYLVMRVLSFTFCLQQEVPSSDQHDSAEAWQ